MNTLFDAAYNCIIASEPNEKTSLTRTIMQAWHNQTLPLTTSTTPQPIIMPGLPPTLRLVPPQQVPHRKLTTSFGQAALLHALAHIEFNAINLAWDAVYRFRGLPVSFYEDWIQVAVEEALHFDLLHEELQKLGYHYGDLTAHNGLWEMALQTADDVMLRMALVPRLLEARGLDAMPPMIAKVKAQGWLKLVEILEVILRDEIGHVAVGSRWFRYCCQQQGLEPEKTFSRLVTEHFKGTIKLPLNTEARLAGGFSQQELHDLISRA